MTGELPWLERLSSATDADVMRADLRKRYPIWVSPQSLIIFGASDEGYRLANLCQQQGIEIIAVVDDNPLQCGRSLGGVLVCKLDELHWVDREIPVVIASHRTLKASKRLLVMGFSNVVPFALLQTMYPDDFPPHPFCAGWLEDIVANREAYIALAGILADDFSRAVLNAVLGYRMSGDPLVLEPVIEWDIYGPANLLSYTDNEVYLDGGSFDGDSIRLFMERVGGTFSRIIAFEPDPATFQQLAANFQSDERIELIAKGLYSRTTMLGFDNNGSRASGLSEAEGTIKIAVTTVDEVLVGDRATYIKMNIEGAEQAALAGAQETIARWHPKLAISAYHRAADLWQIPLLLGRLDPSYRLYLRQHDGGLIETVLYALPGSNDKADTGSVASEICVTHAQPR